MHTHASRPLLAAGLMIAAATAPLPTAAAQDCRLSVQAVDPVLMPGETTPVYVWAHFPASAFAFASANFDVQAGFPGWAAASAGVIAGANVFNIAVSQQHTPPLGILADPANPRRIWHGTFAPVSYEPALVRIHATPTAFSYYPSELTPSSVTCDADPGRDYVLVNPVAFGAVLAAPGEGTTMQHGTNGVDILLGGDGDDFICGILPPRHVQTRIHTFLAPSDVRIGVQVASDTVPVSSYSLNFSRIEFEYKPQASWPSHHSGGMHMLMADGSVHFVPIDPDGGFPILLPRLPDTYHFRVEMNAPNQTASIVADLGYDEPFPLELPGVPGGSVVGVEVRMTSSNNLHQLGLACHTFEVRGASSLALTFEGTCPADANADGAIDSTDISAFLTAWLAGVQTNTPDADFNADGQTDSADISAFLTAWLRAVNGDC